MRRSVVVTVLGATLSSCGSKPVPPTNPPPVEPPPAPAPPDVRAFTKVLNATDAEHGRVYRRSDATCYVHLPFEAGDGPPLSFRPPPMKDVACPPSMTDPSWTTCAFGTVSSTEDGSACLCGVIGNPPPPPRPIPCPVTERP